MIFDGASKSHRYKTRKAGDTVDREPTPSAKQIANIAEWGDLRKRPSGTVDSAVSHYLPTLQYLELELLKEKVREAIAYADKKLLAVNSACSALSLARLYAVYGDDRDRAMRI